MEPVLINLLTINEVSITDIADFNLPHHLSYNNTDVFIVNLHTLETVNFLHLINKIRLQCILSQDVKDIMWISISVTEGFSGFYNVTIPDKQMLSHRNSMFITTAKIIINKNCPLSFYNITKPDYTGYLREDSRILGPPSFKKFSYPGETTGDILGLNTLLQEFCQCFTNDDFFTIFYVKNRPTPGGSR